MIQQIIKKKKILYEEYNNKIINTKKTPLGFSLQVYGSINSFVEPIERYRYSEKKLSKYAIL